MGAEQSDRPWFAGTVDETGMTISILDDPYSADCPILLDGKEADLVPSPAGARVSVNRRRDGGSTTVHTSLGDLWLPIRGGASFDGKPITMDSDCQWVEIQKRWAR